jgi:uncharacterized protein DUF4136
MMMFLVLLGSATVAPAQEVHYNYDREVTFTAYKTYRWAERSGVATDQLLDHDIRRAIDGQLAQKGLVRVEGPADLELEYRVSQEKEKQLDVSGFGPRWWSMARASTSTVEVGALLVNFYDPAIQRLVWRGTVSKTVDLKNDPDKNYRNLEKAVAKLLRNYPPKSRK